MTSYRYFVCSPFYFWHYITVCLFSHHLAFAFPLGNIVDVLCSTFGGHIQWHEDDHVFSFSFRTYNLLYTKICGMSRKSSYTHAHAHTKWTFNFRFVYLWRARGWHHIIDISCIETLLYSMISLYYLYCIDWYIPVDQIKVVHFLFIAAGCFTPFQQYCLDTKQSLDALTCTTITFQLFLSTNSIKIIFMA